MIICILFFSGVWMKLHALAVVVALIMTGCGGGGGESGQSTALTESTQNQGQINLANGIRLADVASELNA